MPPMVAREAVETSTGNHSPCGFSARLRSSSTMPGSTTQRRVLDIDFEHAVEMFRAIDDQRRIHRLPALRGAAAARQHRDALLARDRDRARRIVHGARRHHAERHDLIMGGVGGIAAAGEAVEPHLARDLGFQPPFQTGRKVSAKRYSSPPPRGSRQPGRGRYGFSYRAMRAFGLDRTCGIRCSSRQVLAAPAAFSRLRASL